MSKNQSSVCMYGRTGQKVSFLQQRHCVLQSSNNKPLICILSFSLEQRIEAIYFIQYINNFTLPWLFRNPAISNYFFPFSLRLRNRGFAKNTAIGYTKYFSKLMCLQTNHRNGIGENGEELKIFLMLCKKNFHF